MISAVSSMSLLYKSVYAQEENQHKYAAKKRVLFISSYSYAWETVPEQIAGIKEVLNEDVVIDYKFMDSKNLTSSESFLDQLAAFRMETTLPIAIKHDVKYQKAQKKCNKANEKIRDLNLTPQQWDTVDAAITAENISSIEYIRIAYKQGIIDAFSILRATL